MISSEETEPVDFRIISEGWSAYEMEDGLLKTRAILLKVVRPKGAIKKGEPVPLGFSFHTVNSVASRVRGSRNPKPKSVDELRNLPQDEVEFQGLEETWNYYSLPILGDNKGLKSRVVVTSIRRVQGEYDAEGSPMYMVDSTIIATPTRIKEHKLP